MNNHNDGGDQYFKKKSPKNPHSAKYQNLTNQWKMTSTWCYHGRCKLAVLGLHNNCSYIIVIELQKLHMYMFSYMANCIYCNLFYNIHAETNMLNCNEL
jgi:hypothetical protein